MIVRTAIYVIVAWVLCLAALVAFHVTYVMPRGRTLAACRDETQVKSDRFSRLTRARSPKEQERRKTEQAAAEQKYADFVFGSNEISKLDFVIREIADRNRLQDFSARHTTTTTAIGTLKLKQIAQSELIISFTGDFPSMLRFVNDLERHQPAVFVNQFTLRGAATKSDTLACDMECSVLYQIEGK
jgi:hypothetical protein